MKPSHKKLTAWHLPLVLYLLMLTLTTHASKPATNRVISLGGDVTGIVHALGATDSLVAVDSTSTWPAEVQQLPDVGYVRQLSTEGIVALTPSVVLATHDAGPPAVIEQLEQLGIAVTRLPPARDADGILRKVQLIGQALGKSQQANALTHRLQQQATTLQQAVDAMPHHPRVVFVMNAGTAGLMVAGKNTAADATIKLAGGTSVVTGYSGYKPLSDEALIQLQPDVLLVMQTSEHNAHAGLSSRVAVKHTPAGEHQQIFAVDGEGLLGFGVHTLELAQQLQTRLSHAVTP